jgi:hypothetical protein
LSKVCLKIEAHSLPKKDDCKRLLNAQKKIAKIQNLKINIIQKGTMLADNQSRNSDLFFALKIKLSSFLFNKPKSSYFIN